MDLPIRFPSETDVIAAEAARFRALSDEDRVRALGDCFREYLFLRASSGRPAELDRFAQEEEDRARLAIQEFVARHG